MERIIIDTSWDRMTRNDINTNFGYLFKDVGSLNQTIKDLIVEAGDSNPEVIQARGGEDVLNDRLNKMEGSISDKASTSYLDDELAGVDAEFARVDDKVSGTNARVDVLGAEFNQFVDVFSDEFNNFVDDKAYKGVLLTLSGGQDIDNNIWTTVMWGNAEYNISNFWSSTSNPSRITIPKGVKKVRLSANTLWTSNSVGERRLRMRKNGAYTTGLAYISSVSSGTSPLGGVSSIVEVIEGDYFELEVDQRSGDTLQLREDPYTWFSLEVVEYSKKVNINREEGYFEIVAHRGASGHAPEHTMKAYQLAIDMGADYIEQDLQLTKDGRLVCMHDSTVNRTTNGTGKVSEFTLAEIKQLDAGDGERVPELEEVIIHFGDSIKYYIETKRPHDTKMDDELIRILRKHNLIGFEADKDRVIIQSFSEESLLYMYQQYSDIKYVKLTSTPDSEDLDKVRKYAIGVGPRFADTDKTFVQNAQAKGLIVHPYTVNSLANMETALSWGVDGLFTNYPDRAISLRS